MPHMTTDKYELPDCEPFWITIHSNGEAITRIRFSLKGRADSNKADDVCRKAAEQIKKWFAGEITDFDLALEPEVTERRMRSLNKLIEVPYSETMSYEELATHCGYKDGATRAAGNICSKNPIPLIIPCHRIKKKDGTLGNFGVIKDIPTNHKINLSIKRALIDLESRYA